MSREKGYYWVREREHWMICEWNGSYFYAMAMEEGYLESELDEIDETPIVRNKP